MILPFTVNKPLIDNQKHSLSCSIFSFTSLPCITNHRGSLLWVVNIRFLASPILSHVTNTFSRHKYSLSHVTNIRFLASQIFTFSRHKYSLSRVTNISFLTSQIFAFARHKYLLSRVTNTFSLNKY